MSDPNAYRNIIKIYLTLIDKLFNRFNRLNRSEFNRYYKKLCTL